MSVFVDTGVFYTAFDSAAPRHQKSRDALTSVLTDAEYGRTTTSDYVYDETVTLTLKRTGRTRRAVSVGEKLRSTDGPNAVSIAETPRADYVLSFDDDFDGIVPRLDPASAA